MAGGDHAVDVVAKCREPQEASLVKEPGKMENLIDQLNDKFGIYLNHLIHVHDDELVLFTSEERVIDDETEDMPFNEGTEHAFSLRNVHPIRSDESCRKYKVTFKGFFVYQVVAEDCIEWSEEEEFTGKFVRIFTKSRYLNFIKEHLRVGWFSETPETEYKHYEFPCSNFIVDVAAANDPEIQEVENFLVQ